MDRIAMDEAANHRITLDLSSRDFSDRIAFQSLLREIATAKVGKVDLKTAKFGSRSDFSELLMTLKSNEDVVEVDVSNKLCSDYITNDGTLCRLLHGNKTLQKLDLSGHSLSHESVIDLVQGLDNNATLTELRLHSCLLDEMSAALILSSCVTNNIHVLDLGANNTFSPSFLNTDVSTCLRQTKNLKCLRLDNSSTMFEVRDAAFLSPFFQALQDNTTLTGLSLRFCRLSDDIGEALLRVLTVNAALLELDLEFSGFGLRGRGNEILLRYLPKFKALRRLNIIAVYKADMAPKLIEALEKNSVLRVFNPCFGAFGHKQSKTRSNDSDGTGKRITATVQGILQRNRRLAQVQPLTRPGARLPRSALAPACSHLIQDNTGAAAAFQMLRYWVHAWL